MGSRARVRATKDEKRKKIPRPGGTGKKKGCVFWKEKIEAGKRWVPKGAQRKGLDRGGGGKKKLREIDVTTMEKIATRP